VLFRSVLAFEVAGGRLAAGRAELVVRDDLDPARVPGQELFSNSRMSLHL